ncbi:MAG TPA: hypothetical protein VH643_10360 [Gemmataceae bacterium]|jgi:hypothetical protein
MNPAHDMPPPASVGDWSADLGPLLLSWRVKQKTALLWLIVGCSSRSARPA